MSRQGDSDSTRVAGDLVRRRAVLGGLSTAALGGGVWLALGRPDIGRLVWDRSAPPPRPPDAFVRELRQLLANPAGFTASTSVTNVIRLSSRRDSSRVDVINAASDALRQKRGSWWWVPSPFEGISEHSFEDALALIRTRCRDDYAAGRMVSIMNWLISRTEAELILLLD